jgi:signal transduction histidine kinase
MLERLDTAFSSQRQFLADTSHDLRTPLTVIRSNVELVGDDPDATPEEWRRAGGIIKRNAEKMSKMIDDLLAAARLQTGRAQAVTVDLAGIVSHKAEEFGSVVAERGVEIVTEPSTAVIEGVEVSLDRALSNLVENAVRVAPTGSVVRIASGTTGKGWAWMAVRDEGPGISSAPEERVGLGLSIVSQIAEGHGGSLAEFPNEPGPGMTMVVWIPTEVTGDLPPRLSPMT